MTMLLLGFCFKSLELGLCPWLFINFKKNKHFENNNTPSDVNFSLNAHFDNNNTPPDVNISLNKHTVQC